MDITCDGIIIRETAYGEKDKIVTFLTAEYGKISVLAKGVRSISSKNSHAVQLFCFSTFEMTEKNGRYILKTATVINTFYGVRDNIEAFSLASYFADICSTVCTENTQEKEMLRLTLNCFYALSKLHDIPFWKVKAVFEIKCMQINGLAPELSCCLECGKETKAFSLSDGRYDFVFSEGGIVCNDCAGDFHTDAYMNVSKETLVAINSVISLPQGAMLKFEISEHPDVITEFCLLCEKYLLYQTSKRYETLSFYKSVMAL